MAGIDRPLLVHAGARGGHAAARASAIADVPRLWRHDGAAMIAREDLAAWIHDGIFPNEDWADVSPEHRASWITAAGFVLSFAERMYRVAKNDMRPMDNESAHCAMGRHDLCGYPGCPCECHRRLADRYTGGHADGRHD